MVLVTLAKSRAALKSETCKLVRKKSLSYPKSLHLTNQSMFDKQNYELMLHDKPEAE